MVVTAVAELDKLMETSRWKLVMERICSFFFFFFTTAVFMCKLYNDIIGLSCRLIKHCENESIFFDNTLV